MFGLIAVLLVALAVAGLAVGANYLTQATLGVGILAGAAVVAILARIAQAQYQHREQMDAIDAIAAALDREEE